MRGTDPPTGLLHILNISHHSPANSPAQREMPARTSQSSGGLLEDTLCCAASPRPRSSPASQNFVVNSTVVVQCLSDSHPTPTFTWRRDGSVVTSSDRLKVEQATGKLIIYAAAETDAGLWECVASNEHGEGTAVAQLDLIG